MFSTWLRGSCPDFVKIVDKLMGESTSYEGDDWRCLSTIQYSKGGWNSVYTWLKLFVSSRQIFFPPNISRHPKSEVRHWSTFENPIRSLICIFRHLITFKTVVASASESWIFRFIRLRSTNCGKVTHNSWYWMAKKCRSWNILAVYLISITHHHHHNHCSFVSLFHFLKFL